MAYLELLPAVYDLQIHVVALKTGNASVEVLTMTQMQHVMCPLKLPGLRIHMAAYNGDKQYLLIMTMTVLL